jgi:hypothetical protein
VATVGGRITRGVGEWISLPVPFLRSYRGRMLWCGYLNLDGGCADTSEVVTISPVSRSGYHSERPRPAVAVMARGYYFCGVSGDAEWLRDRMVPRGRR